jgi:hypothetical protein
MELLRELRAALPPARAEARARARGRLVARFEQGKRQRSDSRLIWPSRGLRLLAAGAFAGLLAAAVVALGVFGDGSRVEVESAAAEALHRTATVAETHDTASVPPPGPGQFLYTKTKLVDLEGWLPHGHFGSKDEPRFFTAHVPDPYPQALVPTVVETWTALDGTMRKRETLGQVRFFSAADQRRWEAAGSPPPWAFDPRWHDVVGRNRSGQLVKDYETRKWAPDVSFPDPSELPTDPKALRLAVEHGRVRPPWVREVNMVSVGGEAIDRGDEETIEQLFQILEKPTTTPVLRAATFNALAEVSGIGLDRDVTDVAGRHGEAIVWHHRGSGLRSDYIFDPDTAELLAQGETVVSPKPIERAVPVGTAFRQIAYLQSGIVDSRRETAAPAPQEGSH